MEIKSAIQFAEPTIGDSIFNDRISIKTRQNPLVTLDVKGYGVDGILIPNGSSGERPLTDSTYIGCIRYNTDLNQFEGLSSNGIDDGVEWIKLGGISDFDGDTKITTETSTGNDDDILKFYAGNVDNERLTILGSNGNVGIGTSTNLNDKLVVNGTINATNFKKGGDEITSTASELNLLNGSIKGSVVNNKAVIYGSHGQINATKLQIGGIDITLTPNELNLLDGSESGNIIDSKAVIYGSSGEINATKLQINGTDITSTPNELNLLDESVAGTIINSKAVIYGFGGEINATKLQIEGIDITSTATELNLLDGSSSGNIFNSKAVIYGSGGEINATKLQVSGSDITSTPNELNLLDGSIAGTIVNSKAVIYGSAGEINASKLQVSGSDITSTPLELNLLDGSIAGTIVNSKAVIYNENGNINANTVNLSTIKGLSNDVNINNYDGNGIEITNTVSKGLVVIGTNATESISGGTKLFVNGKIKTNNDIISSKLISNTNTSLTLNNYNNSGIIIDGSDNKVKINTNLEVDENSIFKKNLEVQGDITIRGQYLQIDTETLTSESMKITNSGTTPALTIIQTGATDSFVVYDSISDNASSPLDLEIAFIIKDNGNIGIGTHNPTSKLDINGTVNITGNTNFGSKITSGLQITGESPSQKLPGENSINLGVDLANSLSYIDISSTNSLGGYIDFSGADDSDFYCRIRGNKISKKLIFYTNSSETESLTLDSNGNISIIGDILLPTNKTLKINNIDQINRLETYIDDKFKTGLIAQLDNSSYTNCDNIELSDDILMSGTNSGLIYYDQDMTTQSKFKYLLAKGDYIKINSTYYRIYRTIPPSGTGIDQYGGFTLVDNTDNISESTDDYTAFTLFNKANFNINLTTTGSNGLNNNNILSNNIITIPENRNYNINISARFDLSTGTGYSILYVKVNNSYYRSFYLPSITPINDSSSSTLNASFKLKLNQNDLVTFESNYKLSSCFIDFD